MRDGTHRPRSNHDLVRIDQRVFVDRTIDVTTRYVVANLERLASLLLPEDAQLTLTSVGVKSHFSERSKASVLIPRGI